jgi:DNA-binding XRE family transcriptional regulator
MKNKLGEIRRKNNMTQNQLINMLGISQQTLSSWEVGRTTPKPYQMQFIEELFEVNKEVIFYNDFNYKNKLNI